MKRVSLLILLAMSTLFAMASRPDFNGQPQNRATLTYDFETGTSQGWTAIDADGDGFNWMLHEPDPDYAGDVGHNESDYYVLSQSYDFDAGALVPDNYLVSPQITLGGSITFYAQAQDVEYAAEHFGLAVSTTTNATASAFTTIQEWTMTAKRTGVPGNRLTRSGNRTTEAWYQYTVDLSAYSGLGYVAIRHFNCTDMFYLNVDDITIVEGTGGSTPTTYTVTATANPTTGGTVSMDNAMVFSDDFENGIASWTTIDADGDGNNWYILNWIDAGWDETGGHSGDNWVTSASYLDVALTPDNYLVSPRVALNGTFSFWACAQDNAWAAEHFGVAVSTTNGTSASAFTTIQEWTLSAKSGSNVFTHDTRDGQTRDQGNWYQYTVDLSSYNGQMGYIAIRHFNCTDMFRINVDDVELTASSGGSTISGIFEAGQTCTLTATPNSGYVFINWTENGSTVSGNATYSFTVNGNRNLVANFQQQQPQNTYTISAYPNPEEGGYVTITSRGDRDELTYDFENSSLSGWTVIDADGDGHNWDLASVLSAGYLITGHDDSQDFICSESYYNADNVVLTPDNYIVSPQVQLGGSISFWACAQDASWASEHFGVAVSTTSNTNATAFTTIQSWTMTAKSVGAHTSFSRSGNRDMGAWYQYTVDLSAYAGQTGYVAIRHYDCSDFFMIDVDDITIVEGTSGGGEIGGLVSAVFDEGQTCVLTAYPYSGYYFVNWTEDGAVVTATNPYSFTVDRNRTLVANFQQQQPQSTYTITATANPTEGGTVSMDDMVIFSDDFENGVDGWTMIDADGDGNNWYILNWIDAGWDETGGHSGDNWVTSASYLDVALTPDNYLVSPQLTLGGTLTFWASAQDPEWAAEHFGVAVSTTSNTDASAFTTIQEWTMTAKGLGGTTPDSRSRINRIGTYYQYSVDLSAYAGQMGYIAIRHFNCTDMFRLNVDDVELSATSGGTTVSGIFEDGQTCTVTATPNPGYHFVNWTENGNVVSSDLVYSFTVNGDRNLMANFSNQTGQTYTITAYPDPEEGGYVIISVRDRDELFYDFEESMQGWTTIDADGDGYFWEHHVNTGAGNHATHSGDATMTSASYDNDSGEALTPDNYLVSPQVQLGGSITFYASAQDASWPAEHFGVAVSTTSNSDASAFTTIQEWTMTAKSVGVPTDFNRQGGNRDSGAWYEYTVDLSDYAGETGYVAIRHFNCSDMFYLNVDDITIVEGTSGGGGEIGGLVSAVFDEGQTCVLSAFPYTGYYFVNWTEDGTEVTTTNPYSFVVDRDRTLVAHFEVEFQNYTINVTANPTDGGNAFGSGSYAAGQSCTVVAVANDCYTFINWTEDGTEVSTEASYTFTVMGNRNLVANFEISSYTITATPNPVEGGTVAVSSDRDNLFFDFEDGTQGWTTIDADGDGHVWQLGSILMEGYVIPSHNEGVDCMTSQSYDGDAGVALTPDNYLVSPQVTLGGSITFWACAQDPDWSAEHFGLAVSTTSNTDATTFTTIQEWTMTAKGMGQVGNYMSKGREGREGTWYEYTVDLSDYAGETGYVAIRHFNCSDMFYLNVDDITVVEGTGGGEIGTTVSAELECGETCILTATANPNYDFVSWTENDEVVSTNAVYTFTVSGNRNLVANFERKDGVGENNSIDIALYPNPVSDKLTVEATESIDNIEVYTITGALVFSQKNCSEKMEIQTSDLPAGTYVIRMTTHSATEVRRFVKE